MSKIDTIQDHYTPGQHIQDKAGTDYIITYTDKDGVDIKEIDNPQRIRRVGYDDLEANYTIVIHEQSPGVPSGEIIIYEHPKAKNIIPRVKSSTHKSVCELFAN